jgi:hypothetical protein
VTDHDYQVDGGDTKDFEFYPLSVNGVKNRRKEMRNCGIVKEKM